MIQKTFGIYSERNGRSNLAIETGEKHLACWCTDADSNVLQAFEFFQFQYNDATPDFSEVYRQIKLNSVLLSDVYEHVKLVWENSNCMCVPANFFDAALAAKYLDAINGEVYTQSEPFHYTVSDKEIVFRVEQEKLQVMQQFFPFAEQLHKYGVLVKHNDAEAATSMLRLVFYHTHFMVVLFKDEQLQLVRGFDYTTVNEVVYHILNICERTATSINDTRVVVSGFVDHQSALYNELRKYIQNIELENVEAGLYTQDLMAEYPPHYFVSFYKNVL